MKKADHWWSISQRHENEGFEMEILFLYFAFTFQMSLKLWKK